MFLLGFNSLQICTVLVGICMPVNVSLLGAVQCDNCEKMCFLKVQIDVNVG